MVTLRNTLLNVERGEEENHVKRCGGRNEKEMEDEFSFALLLIWICLAWLDLPCLAWLGLTWLDLSFPCLAWLGLAWLGLAWLDLSLLGLAWLGLAWLGWLGLDSWVAGIRMGNRKSRNLRCCRVCQHPLGLSHLLFH